jgi:hypothetical protein
MIVVSDDFKPLAAVGKGVKFESYASVWDAIADTRGQAANLRARAELMQQIAALVNAHGSISRPPE